ncbi:MAG: hypothetical protein IJ085_05475 [Turicibacter sp.]|nr:hypothetical protein [Turicibacter sp.]
MGIQLGSNFTVQTGLPLDDRFVCETLNQRDAIPVDIRYEGMMCYVINERQTFQLIGGIENVNWENIRPEREEGNVHVGPDEPTKSMVWVDTSAETLGYAVPAYLTIFQEFRDAIELLRTELDDLKRAVQDIIDNGVTLPPSGGGGSDSSTDGLFLTEDGDYLIFEDGDYILQEDFVSIGTSEEEEVEEEILLVDE